MTESFEQLSENFHWMGWNLFLAIIPCGLSFILFSKSSTKRSPKRISHNPIWWLGLALFVLFLPNAPYIITDIIHFVDDVRSLDVSTNGVIFILIPQYTIFLLLGYQCYVLSMINFTQYLSRLKLIRNTNWLEISMNLICAIGVYWGRFNRLNSWDVFTQPQFVIRQALSNLTTPNFFIATTLFFVIFTSLYYICKWINLALIFYWYNRSHQISA